MKPADIIDRLGGPGPVSTHCHLPLTTVSNWKLRQSIPARHHQTLLQMAKAKGVKLSAADIVLAHAGDAAA